MKRTRIPLLIAIMLILVFEQACPVYAEDSTITGSFFMMDQAISWDYPFSDGYFSLPSDRYDHDFARLSLGMALAAFRDTAHADAQDDNLIAFLERLGFSDIETDTYRADPTEDSIGFGLARKQVGEFTIIACPVCGGNYSKEWASNLTIGNDVMATGFHDAAQKLEAGVADYLERHPSDGKSKLWIAGFSRAAAVSNITAAYFTDSGLFEDVYAYTFATPLTTRETSEYPNIYNIMQKGDIVPKIPFSDWGYGRFGTDMFLVSRETDADSAAVTGKASELYREMTGSEMVFNSEIDHQLRILLDYLLMLLPDPESYSQYLQPLLVGIFVDSEDADSLDALTVLLKALQEYRTEDDQNKQELRTMLDYLQSLINVYYLRGGVEKLSADKWNPQYGTTNLFNEHLPAEYLSMMFATDDPEALFSDSEEYLRVMIEGDVETVISDGDTVLKEVLRDGKETLDGADMTDRFPEVECARDKKVVTLPAGRSYQLVVRSKSFFPQTVTITGIRFSNKSVRASSEDVYSFIMKRGDTSQITTSTGGSTIELRGGGMANVSGLIGSIYSPTTALKLENNGIAALTVSGFINKLLLILVFIIIELIVSLILSAIRKKKHSERSVIGAYIWHIVNAIIFFILELAMWYFVPVLPIIKWIASLLVCLVIFLYALKGYRTTRQSMKALVVFTLALAVYCVVENLVIGEFSLVKGVVLCVIYGIFFNAAFFRLWHGSRASR